MDKEENFEEKLKTAFVEVDQHLEVNANSQSSVIETKLQKFLEINQEIEKVLQNRIDLNNYQRLLESTFSLCKAKCLSENESLNLNEKKCLSSCSFKMKKAIKAISLQQKKGSLSRLELYLHDPRDFDLIKDKL